MKASHSEAAYRLALPGAIAILVAGGLMLTRFGESYTLFLIALVALTTVVGVGLNILVGLTGQISLGHVGFYAVGAYTTSILTLKGVSFWLALPAAGLMAGALGALLALPALRISGPYLAMVTIAFAVIVEYGTIEWRNLTGGANGLMGITPPTLGSLVFSDREMAALSILMAGASLWFFHHVAGSAWGRAMRAVRDSEVAAQSLGLRPVAIKTVAFALSAALTGLAGALIAPLMTFISPSSFPFSQSLLFLLAVVIGGAGSVLGPLVGAFVVGLLPELLSGFAEYRLLLFSALMLVVLSLAPQGIIGLIVDYFPRRAARRSKEAGFDVEAFLAPQGDRWPLEINGLGITFGGVRAASNVSFSAEPGLITSLIGPNGAGKTTVLNMIGGFYRPDAGTIRLGQELAGAPAWRVARAGIARTYQTTQLFGTMSVLANVLVGLRGGRLGGLLASGDRQADRNAASALLDFVGYRGSVETPTRDMAHVDRRLVEIARALATRPRALLLDEPAAGLMRGDKDIVGLLLRRIAATGIAVLIVEHDMALVMDVSDHIVVLDAGQPIARGRPINVRNDPQVIAAYLGDASMRAKPRMTPWNGSRDPVLSTVKLVAGYGAAPALVDMDLDVCQGEMVALLGANGAGKSTAMRAMSGLLRPVHGAVVLDNNDVCAFEAHAIARLGLTLVPEGRQVFPELTVLDNIRLGAYARSGADLDIEIEGLLLRFPLLRDRLSSRAGLLSGGEQQMLAIARGLMSKPRILLLDEPSLGLSPAVTNDLFDVLVGLRDEGVTTLLVDQMAASTLTVADRGYVLASGRIVRADEASALAGDSALEAAYLGHAPAAEKDIS
jgi:ABC-type branched-subunit amino acid transport system ATPase component/ABC-type branched-subunit amino acid transport system permease subunit